METLKHSIGLYHEALSKQDKRIVERLFQSGAIQLLIASKVHRFHCPALCVLTTRQDTAWSLPESSYLVIIMGVQSYEGKELRYVNYPIMDVRDGTGLSIER